MRLGLGAKFTLTVLAILAGTMAANTFYFLRTSTSFHEEQLVERGRALGRLISLVSPEAILGFDFLLLNDYTREVGSQPDVAYGVIVSPQGVPLSSYINTSDPLVKDSLRANASNDVLKLLQRLDQQEQLIKLEFPITHNDVLLGRFVMGLSRQSLQSESRRQLAIQILVLAVIVLFLSAAIHGVFRFNVLFPIRKLIAASREVGRGRYTTVDVKSADELGLLARAFNVMTEEVKHEQAKLHRQANFDVLTGLPNRMMAFDRINVEISRAKRSGRRFAVLFIDLDDFKNVNDSMGHAVGDDLLVAIGTRLKGSLRDADTVARLGGDEFLILLPDVESEVEVEKVVERLLHAVAEPQELQGHKVMAKGSIGIALYPDNGDSVEELMANADNAMYQAKATANGSAIFFTEEMNIRLRRWSRISTRRWSSANCRCISRGSSRLPASVIAAPRRCCAGIIPSGASSARRPSFLCRRLPGRSCASAIGCSKKPAAAGRPGTRRESIRDSSRSTSPASSSRSACRKSSPS